MIPASTWFTLLMDIISQYRELAVLSMSAEEAILQLIKEIQYDAKAQVMEDLQQYLAKQSLKKE